ncbi:hypothetical protein [Synechococcus sp. UW105]|nr:hypothetical protein [Synechococcus sp. UW105]
MDSLIAIILTLAIASTASVMALTTPDLEIKPSTDRSTGTIKNSSDIE